MPESAKCGACSRPADSRLCWTCGKALRVALVGGVDGEPGLAWLFERVFESAYGGARLSGKSRGSNDTPALSLDERAANLAREIRAAVDRWVAAAAADGARFKSTPLACTWLAHHIGHVMGLESAPTMLADAERFGAESLRIINRKPEVFAGPCRGELTDGTPCGYDLRAEEDQRFVTCRRCGTVADVEVIRGELLERAGREPQPADTLLRILRWDGRSIRKLEFAEALRSVTPRMYAHEDGRRNLRREPGSVPLFALDDVVAALAAGAAEETSGTRRTRRRPVRKEA